MRVFLSWSGETSKALAEILRQWLPSVLQAARPYFSPDDIAKGTRWSSEIAQHLNESRMGLICLTKDNLEAAWVMFEAGALSKNLGAAKVIPILFSVDPADLVGPMTQFQAASFSQEEMRRVVSSLNAELGDAKLEADVLQEVFEMWWPRLSDRVNAVLVSAPSKTTPENRTEKDILNEVLALTRQATRARVAPDVHPAAIDDLVDATRQLLAVLRDTLISVTPDLRSAVDRLEQPLAYLARRSSRARGTSSSAASQGELAEAFAAFRKSLDDDLPF